MAVWPTADPDARPGHATPAVTDLRSQALSNCVGPDLGVGLLVAGDLDAPSRLQFSTPSLAAGLRAARRVVRRWFSRSGLQAGPCCSWSPLSRRTSCARVGRRDRPGGSGRGGGRERCRRRGCSGTAWSPGSSCGCRASAAATARPSSSARRRRYHPQRGDHRRPRLQRTLNLEQRRVTDRADQRRPPRDRLDAELELALPGIGKQLAGPRDRSPTSSRGMRVMPAQCPSFKHLSVPPTHGSTAYPRNWLTRTRSTRP